MTESLEWLSAILLKMGKTWTIYRWTLLVDCSKIFSLFFLSSVNGPYIFMHWHRCENSRSRILYSKINISHRSVQASFITNLKSSGRAVKTHNRRLRSSIPSQKLFSIRSSLKTPSDATTRKNRFHRIIKESLHVMIWNWFSPMIYESTAADICTSCPIDYRYSCSISWILTITILEF